MLFVVLGTAVVGAAAAEQPSVPGASATLPPMLGKRGPLSTKSGGGCKDDPSCQGRGVFNCAGPAKPYPNVPGIMYYSEFLVPPLPDVLDSTSMTYYDYFNIWWSKNPPGGYFNQFVPQLYLGSVLCNSSNAASEGGTAYNPRYQELQTWHLGSEYYFAICDDDQHGKYNCTPETWRSRAATGKLVPVEPGERVWTRFVLGFDWVWTLGMGVVGGGPDRESYVTVERPFMGLLRGTSSWSEAVYSDTSVGGCTEDYNMRPGSIPRAWEVNITVTSMLAADFWQSWIPLLEATCPWAPKGSVSDVLSADRRTQKAHWKISMQPGRPPSLHI